MRALTEEERAALKPLIADAERKQMIANAARLKVDSEIAALAVECDVQMGTTLDVEGLEWVTKQPQS